MIVGFKNGAIMDKERKKYSYELDDRVNNLLPKEIIKAMNKTGWNAFGVFETVKKEINRERRESRERGY